MWGKVNELIRIDGGDVIGKERSRYFLKQNNFLIRIIEGFQFFSRIIDSVYMVWGSGDLQEKKGELCGWKMLIVG